MDALNDSSVEPNINRPNLASIRRYGFKTELVLTAGITNEAVDARRSFTSEAGRSYKLHQTSDRLRRSLTVKELIIAKFS